jgi:predicted short-subunit dehydrogenase-like oxidoreductase (DUF2520 family)
MDIVMIGSGNAAAVLGRKFRDAGHTILQVVSRNASAASKLAYDWDTESTNYLSLINKAADVYVIAVADDAISTIVAELKLPRTKLVVHTAAAVSKDVLKGVSDQYGVFYPLQSLRKEMEAVPDIPVFFDGNDDIAKKKLESLARSISPINAVNAGDDKRMKLHVAAVIANNFINHFYVLLEEYCKNEGVDFRQLLPLMQETARRLENGSPRLAQTGPAIRRDKETIAKHLELLEKYPALKRIYKLFTESIQDSTAV